MAEALDESVPILLENSLCGSDTESDAEELEISFSNLSIDGEYQTLIYETDHCWFAFCNILEKYDKYFLQMDPLEQARRLKRLKVAQLVENIASPLQSKIFCFPFLRLPFTLRASTTTNYRWAI